MFLQGSVLGALLWNVIYDAVLSLTLPFGTQTIGFTDNIAVEVIAKGLPDVTLIDNESQQSENGLC